MEKEIKFKCGCISEIVRYSNGKGAGLDHMDPVLCDTHAAEDNVLMDALMVAEIIHLQSSDAKLRADLAKLDEIAREIFGPRQLAIYKRMKEEQGL